jgi:RNase P subunit RPR2
VVTTIGVGTVLLVGVEIYLLCKISRPFLYNRTSATTTTCISYSFFDTSIARLKDLLLLPRSILSRHSYSIDRHVQRTSCNTCSPFLHKHSTTAVTALLDTSNTRPEDFVFPSPQTPNYPITHHNATSITWSFVRQHGRHNGLP